MKAAGKSNVTYIRQRTLDQAIQTRNGRRNLWSLAFCLSV